MLVRTAVGAAIVGAVWSASLAWAFDAQPEAARFGTEYGKTLPPVGFVQFCAANAQACRSKAATEKTAMTPARWNLLAEVNAYVNGKIAPVSDQELYGVSERWTVPVNAGDCEDYVLLKKQLLEKLGVAAGNLLITVVLDEKREGHAVLTVVTSEGDYILDNRRNDVLRWNETTYTFLKRQSRSNPLQWVALTKEGLKKKSLTTSRG